MTKINLSPLSLSKSIVINRIRKIIHSLYFLSILFQSIKLFR